jgi:N-acetylglucosaminyldiphosphoundecaprenol N-acetyl-beta-D-mannosaminyltransferase
MASEALIIPGASRPSLERAPALPIVELRRRLDLGGVLIDKLDLPAAVERIRGFLRTDGVNQIATVNLDFISIAQRDRYFRDTLNEANLAVADGMPLLWVSRLLGTALPERITGVDLVDECCRVAREEGASIFLLGAAPGVAETAARRLRQRFDGLRVAGVYAPPFGPLSDEENERILATVAAVRPDFLFVALGAPQQDIWIRANRDRLDVPVCMGVGCVLDLLAGKVSRAPRWMQRAGLEWFFRLVQEPGRLWKRYIIDDIPMLAQLVIDVLGSGRARDRVVTEPTIGPAPRRRL